MIRGLVAKDQDGRILVEYLDVLQIDMTRIAERIMEKAMPQVRPKNVIPITKENKDGTPG